MTSNDAAATPTSSAAPSGPNPTPASTKPTPSDKPTRKARLRQARVTAPQRRKIGVRVQEVQQGIEALRLLDLFGGLTASQLSRLLYYRRMSQRNRRRNLAAADRAVNEMCLRPLKDLGLVEVVGYPKYYFDANIDEHPFGLHEINLLSVAGLRALRKHFTDRGYPYVERWHRHLRHDVLRSSPHTREIVNAVAILAGHAELEGYTLDGWLPDADLRSLTMRGQTALGDVEPDAVFVLRKEMSALAIFLEIDRGTEPPDGLAPNSWETKMRKYGRYLKERYEGDALFPRATKPLVLTITTNDHRLERLRFATKRAKNKDSYLFTVRRVLDPAPFMIDGKQARTKKGYPIFEAQDVLGPVWLTSTSNEPLALRDSLARHFSYASDPDK